MKKTKLDPKELTYDGKGLSLVIDNEEFFKKRIKKKRDELKKKINGEIKS